MSNTNREILYRGKTIKDGKWVYGVPTQHVFGDFQIFSGRVGDGFIDDLYTVIPETIGQCTGLHDIDGNRIFEGDIVKHYNHSDDSSKFDIGYVFWDEDHLCFKRTCSGSGTEETSCYIWKNCLYETIGNIHDNPELLEANNE